jgi:hypothetical protein
MSQCCIWTAATSASPKQQRASVRPQPAAAPAARMHFSFSVCCLTVPPAMPQSLVSWALLGAAHMLRPSGSQPFSTEYPSDADRDADAADAADAAA